MPLFRAAAQGLGKTRGPFRTHHFAAFLNVTQMRGRYPEFPGKSSLGHLLAQADRLKEAPQRQWPAGNLFQILHRIAFDLSTHALKFR